MKTIRSATFMEKIRLKFYQHYHILILLIAMATMFMLHQTKLIDEIIQQATTLSEIGVGIASFLFAVQGILLAIPADNPFIKYVRNVGYYFVSIHKFCRNAEIVFMLLLLPMLSLKKQAEWFRFVVIVLYVYAILLTIWAMWILGQIIIRSEESV